MWHSGALNHAVGGHAGVGFEPDARDFVRLGTASCSCLVIEVATATYEYRLLAGQLPTILLVVWYGHSYQGAFAVHGSGRGPQCRCSATPVDELCHSVFPLFANVVPSLEGSLSEPCGYSFNQLVSDVAWSGIAPDASNFFPFLPGRDWNCPLLPECWDHPRCRPPLLHAGDLGLLFLGGSVLPLFLNLPCLMLEMPQV